MMGQELLESSFFSPQTYTVHWFMVDLSVRTSRPWNSPETKAIFHGFIRSDVTAEKCSQPRLRP